MNLLLGKRSRQPQELSKVREFQLHQLNYW